MVRQFITTVENEDNCVYLLDNELLDGLGLREMEYFLIWCTWIRQGLVSI